MSDESDGKRNPYMRLWIDDARSSCQVMSAAQFGAHMRMLMHGWERGYVPADERVLRRIVGDIDWAEMLEVLERWKFVTLEDGTEAWINGRQERERERMIHDTERRRASGKKGAHNRWNPKTTDNDDGKEHGKQDGNGHGENMAFPNSQTPTSQTPTSQTPLLSSDGDAAPSKRGKRKPSNDPLRWTEPEGWVGVTDADHGQWAELFPAVNSQYELKRLDRWLRDNPTKAHKSNWRKWLNKLFGIKQDNGGSSSGGSSGGNAGRTHARAPHIAADCHPEDYGSWYTTDGRPRNPMLYRTIDGRRRLLSGEYLDEPTTDSRQDQVA